MTRPPLLQLMVRVATTLIDQLPGRVTLAARCSHPHEVDELQATLSRLGPVHAGTLRYALGEALRLTAEMCARD